MKILIFATAYNGLCQRVHQELKNDGHLIDIELTDDSVQMFESYQRFRPDLVICPFLKHRVPDAVWQSVPCLILHPGIAGDQGPSSLDWAIMNDFDLWGATLLQANHEFDAGNIWDTSNFVKRKTSKASLYRREVSSVGAKMIKRAVNLYRANRAYRGLNDQLMSMVARQWQPPMKQSDRLIDWYNDSGDQIQRKINAGDSYPGVLDDINGFPVYLYGAKFEADRYFEAKPGDIVGHKDEAIARVCRDGLIWIRQLKRKIREPYESHRDEYFKLPALRVVNTQLNMSHAIAPLDSAVQREIRCEIIDHTAYLYFDFYNGAFNTEQCKRLLAEFKLLELNDSVKVITLMGGENFWSNGIHLHCIEHAEDSARESQANIEAIDDLAEAIIRCDTKLTVAALRCNAGAGGAILPLACDYVIAREGVVLNPHYQTMGLTGSEYWTYLLPKRVGQKKAQQLMTACLPVIASDALQMNLVDLVYCEDWQRYHANLFDYCRQLSESEEFENLLDAKQLLRAEDEKYRALANYRHEELAEMREIFYNPDSSYHRLRANFVRKIHCGQTPQRLRADPTEVEAYEALQTQRLKVG